MSKIEYTPSIGRKVSGFEVHSGMQDPSEMETIRWVVAAEADDRAGAIREMERIMIERVGVTPMTPRERADAIAAYQGGPLRVVENTVRLVHAAGFVEE
jgi:hypothetical protein